MKTNTLSSKAVLIRLQASAFIGNPRDNVLTAEVENSHGTGAKLISVRKKIMQGKELNLCAARLQALRQTFENLSAPWLDGGIRIVPARKIVDVKVKIEASKREFLDAVENFCAKRDEIMNRDNSPDRLNGAWRASDYPTRAELRAKFGATLEFMPVATDFRTDGIDQGVADEIQKEANRMIAERTKEAKRELLARVAEKLSSLTAKLATHENGKTRFHDSTVTNVSDACEQVEAANFDDDAAISRLVSGVEKTIKSFSIDALKDSEAARKDAKIEAETQLANVQDAMKAFL